MSLQVPLTWAGADVGGGSPCLAETLRGDFCVLTPLGYLLCFLSADQGEAGTKNQQSTNADQPGEPRGLGPLCSWDHKQNEVHGVVCFFSPNKGSFLGSKADAGPSGPRSKAALGKKNKNTNKASVSAFPVFIGTWGRTCLPRRGAACRERDACGPEVRVA